MNPAGAPESVEAGLSHPRQLLVRTAVALVVMGIVRQLTGTEVLVWVSCGALLGIQLALIWAPPERFTAWHYTAAALVAVAAVTFVRIRLGETEIVAALWAVFFLFAQAPRRLQPQLAPAAGFVLVAITLLSYRSLDSLWLPVGLGAGYLLLQARRARDEALDESRRRLCELDLAHTALQQAHHELQETTVDSMRHAALAERTRLAREIHDGLGHQLTSLIVQLQALQVLLQTTPAAAAEAVPKLLEIARAAMQEVRLAVGEWSDDERDLGLAALKGLAAQVEARSELDVSFTQEGELSAWPLATSAALYRVLQESLTNVMRHAQASSVQIRVREAGGQIELSVADDGVYTGAVPLESGFGVRGMVERCRAAGGSCTFAPNSPHGLIVRASLPLGAPEAPAPAADAGNHA